MLTGSPSEMPYIKEEDFIMVIQTDHKKNVANKFGDLGVCCDSTHGTNAYDFNLVTLMVVDEFGEGQPIGWMISNHETHEFLNFFFVKLAENSRKLSPHWFMSDLGNKP